MLMPPRKNTNDLNSMLSFLKDEDLPTEGMQAPSMESIGIEPEKKFLVRKIATEVYVFSDTTNKRFFTKTFENLTVIGEMTEEKVKEYINKKSSRKNQQ